jgi:hypothetical protein
MEEVEMKGRSKNESKKYTSKEEVKVNGGSK